MPPSHDYDSARLVVPEQNSPTTTDAEAALRYPKESPSHADFFSGTGKGITLPRCSGGIHFALFLKFSGK
jgi:hypothetical protein